MSGTMVESGRTHACVVLQMKEKLVVLEDQLTSSETKYVQLQDRLKQVRPHTGTLDTTLQFIGDLGTYIFL